MIRQIHNLNLITMNETLDKSKMKNVLFFFTPQWKHKGVFRVPGPSSDTEGWFLSSANKHGV